MTSDKCNIGMYLQMSIVTKRVGLSRAKAGRKRPPYLRYLHYSSNVFCKKKPKRAKALYLHKSSLWERNGKVANRSSKPHKKRCSKMLPLLGCMIEVCQGPDSKRSDQRRVPLLYNIWIYL